MLSEVEMIELLFGFFMTKHLTRNKTTFHYGGITKKYTLYHSLFFVIKKIRRKKIVQMYYLPHISTRLNTIIAAR